jgi:hypothetical protein
MKTNSTFSAFSVPKHPKELNRQFAGAVACYRDRWHCEPSAVHVRPSTSLPDEVGNIEVVEDDQVPAALWYFEVEEVMTAD